MKGEGKEGRKGKKESRAKRRKKGKTRKEVELPGRFFSPAAGQNAKANVFLGLRDWGYCVGVSISFHRKNDFKITRLRSPGAFLLTFHTLLLYKDSSHLAIFIGTRLTGRGKTHAFPAARKART